MSKYLSGIVIACLLAIIVLDVKYEGGSMSPDTEAVISAIEVVTGSVGSIYPDDLGRSMRQAISTYSPEAGRMCYGKSNQFCEGVLLTLELHAKGHLEENNCAN